jgi:hypothetical protein
VTAPPPPQVLEAFGAGSSLELLPGGQGATWRAGDLVLKPVGSAEEHSWICDVFSGWSGPGVRAPLPVRGQSGSWSVDGWGAHVYLAGHPARVTDDPAWFRAASDNIHDALAAIEPPGFLAERNDPWSLADRVVEGEGCAPASVRAFATECAAGVGSPARRQLVHGDLTTNVLRDGDAAAMIDWPPYLWPREWALAVVVVDAVCWQGATAELLSTWSDVDAAALRRALAWRVVTRGLREADPDLTRERATLALVEKGR